MANELISRAEAIQRDENVKMAEAMAKSAMQVRLTKAEMLAVINRMPTFPSLGFESIGERDMRDINRAKMKQSVEQSTRAVQASMLIEPFDFGGRMLMRPPDFLGERVAREHAAQRPAPEPPVAHAVAAPVSEIDPELLEHEKLAKKLGITCVSPEIGVQRLRQVLAEEGITCYDRKAVESYLGEMARRSTDIRGWPMTWAWFPLRQVDLSPTRLTSESSTVYDNSEHPIPLPALMTMERIVDRLGDQVRFLVGAITKGDPFLAVCARGSEELFPFERWNEPSFRGVKA
jgi:hypothetical protein